MSSQLVSKLLMNKQSRRPNKATTNSLLQLDSILPLIKVATPLHHSSMDHQHLPRNHTVLLHSHMVPRQRRMDNLLHHSTTARLLPRPNTVRLLPQHLMARPHRMVHHLQHHTDSLLLLRTMVSPQHRLRTDNLPMALHHPSTTDRQPRRRWATVLPKS